MAKHRPWYRVVTGAGDSPPMPRAEAEAYRLVHGGRIVPCLPPTLDTREQLSLPVDKPKGLH